MVNWIPQDVSTQKPPVPQGPDVVVGTVDEAAAKIGFRPTETRYPGAQLRRVTIRITPGVGYETRTARLDYVVNGMIYTLNTYGNFHLQDGQWVAIENRDLPAYGVSAEPLKNIRTIKVGDHEGIAFEMSQVAQAATR